MTLGTRPAVRDAAPAPAYASAPRPPGHIPVLDGMRGVAILAVLVYHFTLLDGAAALDRVVRHVAAFGWIGVDLFFVLSGFLITGILYDARGRARYFRNFYARRSLRIFPLYFVFLAFTLLVLPLVPHPQVAKLGDVGGDAMYYALYLSNVAIAKAAAYRHAMLDVTWSLAIEEQFYLLWPLVVLVASRRRLMQICAGVLALTLAVRLALVLSGVHWIAVYVSTPTRLDGLAIGSFLALASRGDAGLVALLPAARRIALAAAAVLVPVLVGFAASPAAEVIEYAPFEVVGYSCVALLAGALVVHALCVSPAGPVGRTLSGGVLRTFGKYSYALYLFNLPVRTAVRDLVFHPARVPTVAHSQLAGQLAFYVVATSVSLAGAWASWHVLEKHFLKLKGRFA